MNRRNFIGTLAALAGVALAKIKAPAAPKYIAGLDPAIPGADHLAVYCKGDFACGIAGERLYAGDMVIFKNDKIYRYPIQPLTGSDAQHFRAGYIPIDKPAE